VRETYILNYLLIRCHSQEKSLKTYISPGINSVCVAQMVEFAELNWKRVLTSDGIEIGHLEGGKVDTKTWRVTHVNIGLNDHALTEFGLKKPFLGRILICLPIDMIKSVNDTVTLKQSLEELKESKECKEFVVR